MERVCIFIDGSNFYHAMKEAGLPVAVDFACLGRELAGSDRRLIHTYYYNSPLTRPRRDDPDFAAKEEGCRAQQRFFNALRFVPNLTFRPGRLQHLPNGQQVEKGVDVALAVDLVTLAFKDRYDIAILISSDADFKHAIETVKYETGKQVELHQIEGSRAYDLITSCSVYVPIPATVIRQCQRTPKGGQVSRGC